MKKIKDGVISLKELDDYNNQESRLTVIRKEIKILEESLRAWKNELDKEQRVNRYKHTTAAIKKNKYWAANDFSNIAKIIKIEGDCGIEYVVTDKNGKDQTTFSSSLGIIWRHPLPITKEKYDELYNKF